MVRQVPVHILVDLVPVEEYLSPWDTLDPLSDQVDYI